MSKGNTSLDILISKLLEGMQVKFVPKSAIENGGGHVYFYIHGLKQASSHF
jgi:hypothetical protein